MDNFIYAASPIRVIFGRGISNQLVNELVRQGLQAAIILSTPGQVKQALEIKDLLGSFSVGIFSKAAMHTPVAITTEAVKTTMGLKADSIVSVGGGSTIGLGKAISIRTGLPHISVVTTYSGSEMTNILGETDNGLKTTRRDAKILPGTVIYDVDLTLTLPRHASATSGVNALAHAVEALYAHDANPIVWLLAKEGIRALSGALVSIVKSDQNYDARSRALYGAWLCGICLGSTSMSLHHKLCHVLGGSFNLPHAVTHTILLPHTIAYNSVAAPMAMEKLAEALQASDRDPVRALNNLLDQLHVGRSLKDVGFQEADIARATDIVIQKQYPNPRPVNKEDIKELLRRAWAGEPAKADL